MTEINGNTRLEDIIREYPGLPDKLAKLDPRLKIVKTPIGRAFIRKHTVSDAAKKAGVDEETVILKIRELTGD